jgi:hypothetical protein
MAREVTSMIITKLTYIWFVVFFVGCSTPNKFYTKQYFTQQEWGRDYSECSARAGQSSGGPSQVKGGLGAVANYINNKNVQRVEYWCLVGKGWKYVDENGNEIPFE